MIHQHEDLLIHDQSGVRRTSTMILGSPQMSKANALPPLQPTDGSGRRMSSPAEVSKSATQTVLTVATTLQPLSPSDRNPPILPTRHSIPCTSPRAPRRPQRPLALAMVLWSPSHLSRSLYHPVSRHPRSGTKAIPPGPPVTKPPRPEQPAGPPKSRRESTRWGT